MRNLLVLLTLITGCNTGRDWERLPNLPNEEGIAGAFGGTSNGALLVAGGANFPDAKPWDGGKKVWYDTIFVLKKPDGEWRSAGTLPRPLAYGVSLTHHDAVVCVGGSDANRHYADAFRLQWKNGELTTSSLPSLPQPLANASGAVVGDHLYVVGGQHSPDAAQASRTVYRINLAAPQPRWEEIQRLPGRGRIFSVAAGSEATLWVAGGADLAKGADGKINRTYLKDGYRFDADRGWTRLADLPHPVAAAPTPAPTGRSGFSILGGDDGSQAACPPERHSGFSRRVLHYDIKSGTWADVGRLPVSHVTTPCVRWNGSWVIPSGEVRPGVRSPQVWALTSPARE